MNSKARKLAAVALATLLVAAGTASVQANQLKGSVSMSRGGQNKKVPLRSYIITTKSYKDALAAFNKKNYAEALRLFDGMDANGFCCDLVHYYIAQCYQLTNQTAAAQMHYDIVLNKSKDANLRRYAEYANETLAYYGTHRTYAGQGNRFDVARASGGGGGGMRRG
jgi:pentatricopeptide repeat protein